MPPKRDQQPGRTRMEWRLAEGRVEEVPEAAGPACTWVALDFETANERRDSVCAVGIARVCDGRVVDRRSWLVRPEELRFNDINIGIHGITADDVRKAPTFDRLWPELEPILSKGTVIAHNAGFDMSVLRHTLDLYGIPYPPIRYLCTVTLSRLTWPRLSNHKLNTVADHLGMSLDHHDAEDDAVACAGVSLHCCRRYRAGDVDELAEKLGIRHGRLHRSGYTPPRRIRRRRP